jgi:hypothetical protein
LIEHTPDARFEEASIVVARNDNIDFRHLSARRVVQRFNSSDFAGAVHGSLDRADIADDLGRRSRHDHGNRNVFGDRRTSAYEQILRGARKKQPTTSPHDRAHVALQTIDARSA